MDNLAHVFLFDVSVLYTIEFQKRGLPHCHTLLWVHSPPLSPINQRIDDYISAELPDPRTDPVGYAVICATTMHGPCGLAKSSAPCMERSACSKKFPKLYNSKTYFDADGCAHYQRRNNRIYTTRGGVKIDNSYVVPYNLLLCLTFHAHINVEFCGWKMLIKYLFKYISKGTDRVTARITRHVAYTGAQQSQAPKAIDEIQNFIDARFICPHEACWRIFNFPIHHREPAVQILGVHLENMQLLTFHSREPLESIVQTNPTKKMTLTQWLHYNSSFCSGHHLTYLDFPLEFVWYDGNKCWKQRANLKKPCIGRLTYIHPAFGEAFLLRMLLCHQKGCKSFADIRTVNNIVHSTYRSACEAIGLLGDDKDWSTALEEVSVSASSSELRSLFANILMYCSVTNPLNLWEKHWKLMFDDISIRAAASLNMSNLHINTEELHNFVLYEVELLLNQCSRSIAEYGLPSLPPDLLLDLANRLIMEEKNYDRELLEMERVQLESVMNSKQKIVYDLITRASYAKSTELIFVYGLGGTGKTFLWKAIITALRARGKIVLAVASSGIAFLLLPSGRMTHSRFKLPLVLTDESMCNVKKNTQMAKLLQKTDLIMWDEAPMNNRRCFEAHMMKIR
ncbi:uncharacterized protein [Rutidosis leptorrhynchoides]|uniref:uncharacterized protein n=1 Tax=Rutidosis leptorrhynchoides TaxID=125765 RepID=UPI003A98F9BA